MSRFLPNHILKRLGLASLALIALTLTLLPWRQQQRVHSPDQLIYITTSYRPWKFNQNKLNKTAVLAAEKNWVTLLKVSLEHGADIDYSIDEDVNNLGYTPLAIATMYGNYEVVKILVDRKAQLNPYNPYDGSPLHLAARKGHFEIAKYLIQNGAHFQSEDHGNTTALHEAAQSNDIRIARLLIQNGAKVNAQDSGGETPLHVAAHYDNVEVAELLLMHHANPRIEDLIGRTPFLFARRQERDDMLKLFLKYDSTYDSTEQIGP